MKEEYFMNGKVEPTNEGYAIAKIVGMKLCEKIHSQYGKNFISCMPTNIYGPNDNFKDDSAHVIPSLIRRIHQAKVAGEKTVVIWGGGNSRREFLYVEDLADAVFWLMNHYDKNEFLNIGTGVDVSIKELAYEIKKIVQYKGTLVFDISKPDGMPKKLLDVSKINKLGWKYKTSFEKGLDFAFKWFLEHQNI
jgi:GDP-L-fucose synthase